jgi:K+ transporter
MSETTEDTLSDAPSEARHNLVLGVLGMVYGDIGTSPLYTVKQ